MKDKINIEEREKEEILKQGIAMKILEVPDNKKVIQLDKAFMNNFGLRNGDIVRINGMGGERTAVNLETGKVRVEHFHNNPVREVDLIVREGFPDLEESGVVGLDKQTIEFVGAYYPGYVIMKKINKK